MLFNLRHGILKVKQSMVSYLKDRKAPSWTDSMHLVKVLVAFIRFPLESSCLFSDFSCSLFVSSRFNPGNSQVCDIKSRVGPMLSSVWHTFFAFCYYFHSKTFIKPKHKIWTILCCRWPDQQKMKAALLGGWFHHW